MVTKRFHKEESRNFNPLVDPGKRQMLSAGNDQIQPRHEHDRWPQRIGQDNYP